MHRAPCMVTGWFPDESPTVWSAWSHTFKRGSITSTTGNRIQRNRTAMRVLGIITARGGSRGIPRKNVTLLLGKPLLAYTAEAALASKKLTRTVLSTDDVEIAKIGRQWGIDIPFPRPVELARDETPTIPVLQDV